MDEDPQPEQVGTLTLLEKANQLRTKAELIGAQQSDTDELTRITHRVATVKLALQKFDRSMTGALVLADLPDATTINMTADDGYDDFRRKIEDSDFKDSVFRTAARKLDAAATRLDAECERVWTTWTTQRLGKLRRDRIAALPAAERRSVRERCTRLDRVAGSPPDRSSVTEFVTTYENLRELLDDLPDLPGDLVDLLERLSQKAPLTIADLSDDDLRIIRESEVGSQIELRRRES